MVNVSKIIVVSNIVVSAAVASMKCVFQKRFGIKPRQHKRQGRNDDSRRMEEDANSDQNCDYRGGFSGGLNV